MTMKTIKVAEATNLQLNWLVARCDVAADLHFNGEFWIVSDPINGSEYLGNLDYTGDWSLMGPIIEREGISTVFCCGDLGEPRNYWAAFSGGQSWDYAYGPYHEQDEQRSLQLNKEMASIGPTSLIAAARCYCCAKLGETAEVPEELT